MKLSNRVAIITGGGTGIGRAIALEFAREGADVVLSSRNRERLEAVAAEVKALGRQALAIAMDVGDKEQVDTMVNQAIAHFNRIDILVNNSGVEFAAPFLDITEEEWDDTIETNLKGVFLCSQAVGRQMIQQKRGRIINMTSTIALGAIYPGWGAYAASKYGVNALTLVCAREFGPFGINVNAIAPGRILTPLVQQQRTPEQVEAFMETGRKANVLGRIGMPEDIARVALFLASDDASFISGQLIAANGGRMDKM
jgi:NAD(P)-dependent dehydrogenase (short-subunit alcohol dehydrogenase family)